MNNAYNLLVAFKDILKDLYNQMITVTHDYNGASHPYHIEGSIWTHTMLVYNYARLKTDDINSLAAALFHDIGKITNYSINEKYNKTIFPNHSYRGAFECLDYIDILNNTGSFNINKYLVSYIINLHNDLNIINYFDNDKYDYNMKLFYGNLPKDIHHQLINLIIADNYGRIGIDEDTIKHIKDTYIHIPEYNGYYNNKPKLIMLIGLPGSGKSTFYNTIENKKDYVKLSFDEILYDIKPDTMEYHECFKDKKILNDAQYIYEKSLTKAIKDKQHILIDRTNTHKKGRRSILNNTNNYYKIAYVFIQGNNILTKRNKERANKDKKYIDSSIINSFIDILRYPLHDEFNEIYIVSEKEGNDEIQNWVCK